jgi:surface polysaccharide O-acyltransferase-like enzyme
MRALEEAGMRQEPTPVHLWFLYYLCYFYIPLPIYREVVRRTTAAGLQKAIDRRLACPWMFVVFGSITTLTLWPFKGGMIFEGFLYFTPHLPSMLYYGTFFVLGYFIHSHKEILGTFRRHVRFFAGLSLVLFPMAFVASYLERQPGASTGAHAAAVVLHAFCTWSLVYLFMGIFLKYFDFESPWIRFISQSSYWVYLVHMPIVGVFGWILLPYDLSAFVKFPIVMAATTVVCFVSYQYLARTTWISVLLNGKRFSLDWPWLERRTEV